MESKFTRQDQKIVNTIKKWIQTVKELETARLALPITRLTSIKRLCTDPIATEQFALYIAKRVQQQMEQAAGSKQFTQAEWEQHQQLVAKASRWNVI